MDLTTIGIGGAFVIVVVQALKDLFPKLQGNITRLFAVLVGLGLGFLGQQGILPLSGLDLTTGFTAAIAAVAVHTVAINGR